MAKASIGDVGPYWVRRGDSVWRKARWDGDPIECKREAKLYADFVPPSIVVASTGKIVYLTIGYEVTEPEIRRLKRCILDHNERITGKRGRARREK